MRPEDKQSEKSAEEYSGESLNRTQTDGDTQKTYILVKAADGSQKPLVVTKTEPEIRGVVVVSRGGSDPKMREKIVEAVKTALDLSLYAGMRGGVQRIYIWQRMKPFSEDRRNTE